MTGQINVNKIAARTGNTITVESGHVITQPGQVIQVVNAEKLDTAATNSAMPNWVDTGLTCSITPNFSNSKILVHVDYAGGVSTAVYNYFRVVRNIDGGTYSMISEAATPGNRNAIHGMAYDADNEGQVKLQTFNHLDSPSTTSVVNYKVQFATGQGGYVYIGQSNRDQNNAYGDPRASSRIVLQEIAQ